MENEIQEEKFYLEYQIGELERHEKLESIFLKIKEEKDQYYTTRIEPSSEIKNWIKYLDADAKKWFDSTELKPNSEQRKVYDQLWKLTKPEIRSQHPMFNTTNNWKLNAVIYVIFEGDYELVKIENTDSSGTLHYDPGGFPFGGTEALVQLIESFGHSVVYDSWHEGPHKRAEIGWDFQLAKELVQQGKGIGSTERTKWWKFW